MLQTVRNKCVDLKNSIVSALEWIQRKYRNNKKKCRATLITLALLFILCGLIVGSFQGVNSLSQGVPINWSDGTIINSEQTNFGSFIGLNTRYYSIPAHSYLLSFDGNQSENSFPAIEARALEGIKVTVQVQTRVRVSPLSLKSFLQQYGMGEVVERKAGWQIYIRQLLRNVVVQSVAAFKFYELSNQALANFINTKFTNFTTTQANYPFIISVIGINIHYPKGSMELNNTLGVRLLRETSRLQQLTTQLSNLNTYITTYQTHINNYTSQRATIDGTIASREQSLKVSSSAWAEGILLMNTTLQNETLLQKYLETYFNSLYNVTYRLSPINPFII